MGAGQKAFDPELTYFGPPVLPDDQKTIRLYAFWYRMRDKKNSLLTVFGLGRAGKD